MSRKAMAPMIEARGRSPCPPKMLVPPITTAATELRMNWSPAVGDPEAWVCPVTQIAASGAGGRIRA